MIHFPDNITDLHDKANAYLNCTLMHGNGHDAMVYMEVNDFFVFDDDEEYFFLCWPIAPSRHYMPWDELMKGVLRIIFLELHLVLADNIHMVYYVGDGKSHGDSRRKEANESD